MNVVLAEKRDELRPKIEAVQRQLENLKPDPETLQKQLERLQRKVEIVGMTSTVGLLLRKDRADLPDTRDARSDIKRRQVAMAGLEFERLELEDRYEALVAGDEQMAQDLLAQLGPAVPGDEREAIDAEIRAQLRLERDYLVSLDIDLTTFFGLLGDLNEKQRQVVVLTEELVAFIDQRILWIQSTNPLRFSDFRDAGTALAWLFNPAEWGKSSR